MDDAMRYVLVLQLFSFLDIPYDYEVSDGSDLIDAKALIERAGRLADVLPLQTTM
jgi:hypothetical protein